MVAEPLFTAQQLAEIRAYHAPGYAWSAVNDAFQLSLYAFVLWRGGRWLHRLAERLASRLGARTAAFPGLGPLRRALGALWGGAGWGTALLYCVGLLLFFELASLPADFYLSFLNEHRYGMSRLSLAGWLWDQGKANAVAALGLAALGFGLYGLARRTRRWWWILGGCCAGLLLAAPLLDPYRDRLYFTQAPLPPGPLRSSLESLLREADVEYREILVEKTSTASVRVQAYFAGIGPTRTIVLNDSLVERLAPDEVLAAVAHEAAHVHEPRWRGRLASAALLVLCLWLLHRLFLVAHRRGWLGAVEYADIRTLPLVTFTVFCLQLLGGPLSAFYSRQRELAADRAGIALTGDAPAFIRMLGKAALINKMDPDPPAWLVWRGLTHPPLSQRLDQARALEK